MLAMERDRKDLLRGFETYFEISVIISTLISALPASSSR